ncbi:MAG: hypothetical protein EAZ09_02945 [Oscillatoriales cyanobacterium]|nr:MAG: hypothetical protein EAZ18_25390 [Oscillatoriales cyanobacterium]TAH24988.1 MAG: hypothetical protein EAZ09_02945 [Oscillatoriales cyanobacterium]
MATQEDRIKQREALEDAHGNFVEPYINQLTEVNAQSLPNIDVALPGFCYVSGWLVLVIFYGFWMRYRMSLE